MARKLKLEAVDIDKALEQARKDIAEQYGFKKYIQIDVPTTSVDDTVSLNISGVAYVKMSALVNRYDTEIAWHGLATRNSDTEYAIQDIMVYPQRVTGATVNTDQDAYTNWLYGLDDNQFSALRMQGHSHVNFATSPSSVDIEHRRKIISQLGEEDFYIFLIINKSGDMSVQIFDRKTNRVYDNTSKSNDISILIDGCEVNDFLNDADRNVSKASFLSDYKLKTASLEDIFDKEWYEDYELKGETNGLS